MRHTITSGTNLFVALLLLAGAAHGAPYAFQGPAVSPIAGKGLPGPHEVTGKEFSQFVDQDALGVLAPQQVVAWDGVGGVEDAENFFGAEAQTPSTNEIDAIAYHTDALFEPLIDDNATLIFSIGNGTAPGGSGDLTTDSGVVIGRSGDLSYESPVTGQMGIWATANQIDDMNPPTDVDGVELWGRNQPGYNTNRYSLVDDANNGSVLGSGVSIYCPGCGSLGSAYVLQDGIRDDVASLLGAPEDFGIESMAIDLDAMILGDTGDKNSIFKTNEDAMIFSIRQIEIPGQSGSFYATGSELFLKRDNGSVEFLYHGGHLWDRDWALQNMVSDGRYFDINALEVVAIPEPASLAAAVAAIVVGATRRNTRRVRCG